MTRLGQLEPSVRPCANDADAPEAVIALSQISVGWDAGRSLISERRSVIVFVIQSDAAAACLAEIALHRHPRSHFYFDHHLARLRGQPLRCPDIDTFRDVFAATDRVLLDALPPAAG